MTLLPLPVLQEDGLPDCKGCGGCCFMDFNVALTDEDIVRLPAEFYDPMPTQKYEYTHWMKTKEEPGYRTHCIAFDPHNRVCTIYENRPKKCREFPRRHPCCTGGVRRLEEELSTTY